MDRRKDQPEDGLNPEAIEGSGSPAGEDGSSQAGPTEGGQQPLTWKKLDRFPIHDRLKDVVLKTIDATKLQLELERKKLHKAKYGS